MKSTAAVGALLILTLTTACSDAGSEPAPSQPTTSKATASPSSSSSISSSTTSSTTSTTSTTQPGTTTPGSASPAATGAARQVPATAHLPALTWTPADDASTVAQRFAQASWQMDTATDTSPIEAQHRAAVFAAPTLADALTSGGPLGGGGAAWAELSTHAGWTTAEAEAVAAPDNPDTAMVAARQVTVTVTAHGDGGWSSTTTYGQQVLFLTLSPAPGGGWLVTDTTSTQQ
jgi:hypothetical protein